MEKQTDDYSLYKSDLVKLGCLKKRRAPRPFAELEVDMTLCMAAISKDDKDRQVIVACADQRAEVDWAGANVAFKFGWAKFGWAALVAGELSKAEDFLATCRTYLEHLELGALDVFDKLNEASCIHKEKLVQRLVRQKLGISFERFLAKGEHELTPEVRTQVLYDIERLNFGCSILVLGFINSDPYIFTIDGDGEVTFCQNFDAIGTGSIIAKAALYQRGQLQFDSTNRTLYHIYEASRLAQAAPAVSETKHFVILEPPTTEGGQVGIKVLNDDRMGFLKKQFKRYAPKTVGELPELNPDDFFIPSDSETSEGQP